MKLLRVVASSIASSIHDVVEGIFVEVNEDGSEIEAVYSHPNRFVRRFGFDKMPSELIANPCHPLRIRHQGQGLEDVLLWLQFSGIELKMMKCDV
jgi:hypothetical protein